MNVILGIVVCWVLAVESSISQTQTWYDFEYQTNTLNEAIITKYIGSASSVTIPSEINGLAVRTIGTGNYPYPFLNKSSVTQISLPNSITNINSYAFYGVPNITNINIPYGVLRIGNNAFTQLPQLKSVHIPSSVTNFESSIFNSATSLTNVILEEGITKVPQGIFSECFSLRSVTL